MVSNLKKVYTALLKSMRSSGLELKLQSIGTILEEPYANVVYFKFENSVPKMNDFGPYFFRH